MSFCNAVANRRGAARTRAPVLSLLLALVAALAPSIATAQQAGVGAARPSAETGQERQVTNADGPCLTFTGLHDETIENLIVGPCRGNGIEIYDSSNVTVRNVAVSGAAGIAIYVAGSSHVTIEESRIEGGSSGVYAVDSTGVRVSCNTIDNPQGPVPRGQFVQFDKVTGEGNAISCNVGRNAPGKGMPEDGISLYQSSGTARSPIAVGSNLIVGGGPSPSGGGIMLGDGGGAHQVAEGNDLVDPGQYGVSVSSGEHMAIRNNRIYARAQSFTNVGIAVWNQSPQACSDIAVEKNQVRWLSKTGQANPYWNGGNCGPVAGVRTNNFRADLTPSALEAAIPAACACSRAGRR